MDGTMTETVPLAEYQRVIEENERLRAELEELRKALSDWEGRMVEGNQWTE